jgi:predicted RNase H-like HicB family nuclease
MAVWLRTTVSVAEGNEHYSKRERGGSPSAANYIAVIHEANTDFGVSFPDDDAKELAQKALTLHTKRVLEDGDHLPESSKLEEIMNDADYADAIAYLVVSVSDPKPRTVQVNITVSEATLKQIYAAAKKRGMSRSSFFVHAAQHAIYSNHSHASG